MKDVSMMTPSEIAFKYDGNKRQIARAVQRKIIDPTAAALAGIFIDRAIQSNLKAPGTTVYEDMYGGDEEEFSQGGVAALPVEDSMYNLAGGGIVAFANRGAVSLSDLVSGQQASDPFYDEDESAGDANLDVLRKYAAFRKSQREQLPSEAREEARKFFQGATERGLAAAQRQRALTGLELAGVIGSTRGSLFDALAAGAKRAPAGLMKAEELERGAEESRIKGMLGLEEKERAEAMEDIKGAEGIAGREIERRLAKDTDTKAAVNAYVAAQKEKIASGAREPASDAALRNEAYTMIRKEQYDPRRIQADAAAYGRNIDAGKYATQLRDKNKRDYNLARQPITKDTSPELAQRIRDAQTRVQGYEAEIQRVTGFIGNYAAPSGGGGASSGQVDTSNPLLR